MTVYCGIDLHANNSVVAVIDGKGKLVFSKRYANDLYRILAGLEPFASQLDSIVIRFKGQVLQYGIRRQGVLDCKT